VAEQANLWFHEQLPCCYWAKLFAIFVDKSVEMGPKELFLLLIKRQSKIDQV